MTWKNSHGWGIEEQLEALKYNPLHPSLSGKMCSHSHKAPVCKACKGGLGAGFIIILSPLFTNEETKVTERRQLGACGWPGEV